MAPLLLLYQRHFYNQSIILTVGCCLYNVKPTDTASETVKTHNNNTKTWMIKHLPIEKTVKMPAKKLDSAMVNCVHLYRPAVVHFGSIVLRCCCSFSSVVVLAVLLVVVTHLHATRVIHVIRATRTKRLAVGGSTGDSYWWQW
jgi:hypothetical protein